MTTTPAAYDAMMAETTRITSQLRIPPERSGARRTAFT